MKYKDRYVLGVGYPYSDDNSKEVYTISLAKNTKGYPYEVKLKIPVHILEDLEMPKYRLVLEKVSRPMGEQDI